MGVITKFWPDDNYDLQSGVPAGIRKCVPLNFQSAYVVRNHDKTSRPGLQSKHVLTATIFSRRCDRHYGAMLRSDLSLSRSTDPHSC